MEEEVIKRLYQEYLGLVLDIRNNEKYSNYSIRDVDKYLTYVSS